MDNKPGGHSGQIYSPLICRENRVSMRLRAQSEKPWFLACAFHHKGSRVSEGDPCELATPTVVLPATRASPLVGGFSPSTSSLLDLLLAMDCHGYHASPGSLCVTFWFYLLNI